MTFVDNPTPKKDNPVFVWRIVNGEPEIWVDTRKLPKDEWVHLTTAEGKFQINGQEYRG